MVNVSSFRLEIDDSNLSQSAADDSFIGGVPKLPSGTAIPQCALCRSKMAFFFQVAFPLSHPWMGESLAVFACVSCHFENHFIPEMLTTELQGANIPAGLRQLGVMTSFLRV